MKERYIYIYYLILLLIMVSWTSSTTFPPFIFRISFMGAVFLPVLYIRNSWLPAIFTCFLSIGQYGISFSYLPETISLYVWVILGIFVLYNRKKRLSLFPIILYFFPFYIFAIDFFADYSMHHIFYAFIIMLLSSYLFDKNYELAEKKMSTAFVIVTMVLCYYFLFFQNEFSQSFGGYGSDLERISWKDPNYLGCVIGMGTLCCGIKLIEGNLNKYIRILLLFVIGIALMVLIMNASRGALLAVVMGVCVLFLTSPIKLVYKIIFFCVSVGFLILLYNNNYFELLEYRIENDSTGSGRTRIWEGRLTAFSQSSFSQMLFGFGRNESLSLGTSYKVGAHNDYIAFLVEYGFVGFFLFLFMLFYPVIKIMRIKDKVGISQVLTLCAYIFTCCLTLEPFTLGRIPYFMFYLYIILIVNKFYNKSKLRI